MKTSITIGRDVYKRQVQSMTDAVTQLENVLLDKLNLFGDCLCSPF